jgi:hypothetical protein
MQMRICARKAREMSDRTAVGMNPPVSGFLARQESEPCRIVALIHEPQGKATLEIGGFPLTDSVHPSPDAMFFLPKHISRESARVFQEKSFLLIEHVILFQDSLLPLIASFILFYEAAFLFWESTVMFCEKFMIFQESILLFWESVRSFLETSIPKAPSNRLPDEPCSAVVISKYTNHTRATLRVWF